MLSIVSGSPDWERKLERLDEYERLIREVLGRQRSFRLEFRGVTASPGGVMVQGFPEGDALAGMRDGLREAFARAGFGGLLDQRYRIRAAHMTAMRFRAARDDWARLGAELQRSRDVPFGAMEAERMELIFGDWYASAEAVRTLREYPLMSREATG